MRSLLRLLARLVPARAALAGACAALLPLAAAHAADADAGSACPPPPQQLTSENLSAGIKTAKDHGFLWRVTKDGRSSYLYGTIHAARAEWMYPGPVTLDALRASDTLALELDVLDPDVQRRLAQSIGGSRTDPLPPALVRRIERQLKSQCVEFETFAKLAPEFQIASLSVMAARRDGLDPAHAIDLVLAVLAREFGKPVASLETPELQMRALQDPRRRRRSTSSAAASTTSSPAGPGRCSTASPRSGPKATTPSCRASRAGATASTPPPRRRR